MMELWGKCFDDSPKFIQHFFSCFYRAPRFVTLERDEQVLASLFMLRCHVLYYGHRIFNIEILIPGQVKDNLTDLFRKCIQRKSGLWNMLHL